MKPSLLELDSPKFGASSHFESGHLFYHLVLYILYLSNGGRLDGDGLNKAQYLESQ